MKSRRNLCPQSRSGKRLFQRGTLRREQLRPVLQNVHIVFQADAELATNIDPRLIAEGHIGSKWQSISAHQIRPFMAIHPHAMTQPVGELLIVGTEARVADDLARGWIY